MDQNVIDAISLEVARDIDLLRPMTNQAQRVARIQLKVADAIRKATDREGDGSRSRGQDV